MANDNNDAVEEHNISGIKIWILEYFIYHLLIQYFYSMELRAGDVEITIVNLYILATCPIQLVSILFYQSLVILF